LTESSKMSYGWEINRGYKPLAEWISMADGQVPHNAVVGGYDISGENLYIGRSSHEDEIIPGKVVPSHGTCYVPYGGVEHIKHNYQVLVHSSTGTDFVWLEASHGEIPSGAIQGGVSGNGERLFIGRVEHESRVSFPSGILYRLS